MRFATETRLAAGTHQKEIIMAEHTSLKSASVVLTNLGKLLPDLEALYKDLHSHPELSMQETRTAVWPLTVCVPQATKFRPVSVKRAS